MTLIKKILKRIEYWFSFYVVCKADRTIYLRKKGVKIGEKVDIFTRIENFGTEPYLIHIGDHVTLASGVLLITHDGATRVIRNIDERWTTNTGLYGTIVIENNVFIGVNAILLPGIHIGSNSVIGAGSVVTKDVVSGTVVAGNPARVICSIDDYRDKIFTKTINIEHGTLKQKRNNLESHFWS